MEVKTNTPKSAYEAFDAYMHIHKKLTGPRTAEKLSSFYESLTQSQKSGHLYSAGWAAAEAAITGVDLEANERTHLLRSSSDAWEMAEIIAIEDANTKSWGRYESPDMNMVFRINTAQAIMPLIEGLVEQDVNPYAMQKSYDSLLGIALANADHLTEARHYESSGRAGSCIGLAHELNSILSVNRLNSPSYMAWPSIARADSGDFYPNQTHDFQIIQQKWGKIRHITPVEVKARVKQRHLSRYEAALVHGRMQLTFNPKVGSPLQTLSALAAESVGEASVEQIINLNRITSNIIHVAEHHRHAKKIGRHCMDISGCELVKKKSSAA